MEPEPRALVVAAELEAAEPRDRVLLYALVLHLLDLATEPADALERGVDVVDREEG